jgi:hypothetical protein
MNIEYCFLRCETMCDTCGCTPCKTCGAPIEDGVCSGCWEPADECVCKPEDQWEEKEDEDQDEDEEQEYEDEEYDEDEDEDYN